MQSSFSFYDYRPIVEFVNLWGVNLSIAYSYRRNKNFYNVCLTDISESFSKKFKFKF